MDETEDDIIFEKDDDDDDNELKTQETYPDVSIKKKKAILRNYLKIQIINWIVNDD